MTNPNAYRPNNFLPKLPADEVQGEQTVLTITSAMECRGEFGPFLSIEFEEFPNYVYITNKTQAWALMCASNAGKLPPQVTAWVGWRVPLRKQFNTNPKTNETVAKLYALPAGEWDAALAEFDTLVWGRPLHHYWPTARAELDAAKSAPTPKPKPKRKPKAKGK